MFIQKYWALFLLPAVAGVVIAIILLSKKTDDTIASPAEDVDLDKKSDILTQLKQGWFFYSL